GCPSCVLSTVREAAAASRPTTRSAALTYPPTRDGTTSCPRYRRYRWWPRRSVRSRGSARRGWPPLTSLSWSRAWPRCSWPGRRMVAAVVDQGSFFEIGRLWGRSLITGFGRLDGWPVGVLAGDPFHYAAGLTADASEKLTRFVDLCDTFHLPAVNFVDQPGFV